MSQDNMHGSTDTLTLPVEADILFDLPGVAEVARIRYATHTNYEVCLHPACDGDDAAAAAAFVPLGAMFLRQESMTEGDSTVTVLTYGVGY